SLPSSSRCGLGGAGSRACLPMSDHHFPRISHAGSAAAVSALRGGTDMDQAAALLVALRAAAALGDGRLEPARVEALAGALGIRKEKLPALAARWQEAKQVKIAWGGVLEVLPEAPANASVVIN